MNARDARKQALESAVRCCGCGGLLIVNATGVPDLVDAAALAVRTLISFGGELYLEPVEDFEEWARRDDVQIEPDEFHS